MYASRGERSETCVASAARLFFLPQPLPPFQAPLRDLVHHWPSPARAHFTRPTTRAHTFACVRLLRSMLALSMLAPSVAPPSVAPPKSTIGCLLPERRALPRRAAPFMAARMAARRLPHARWQASRRRVAMTAHGSTSSKQLIANPRPLAAYHMMQGCSLNSQASIKLLSSFYQGSKPSRLP